MWCSLVPCSIALTGGACMAAAVAPTTSWASSKSSKSQDDSSREYEWPVSAPPLLCRAAPVGCNGAGRGQSVRIVQGLLLVRSVADGARLLCNPSHQVWASGRPAERHVAFAPATPHHSDAPAHKAVPRPPSHPPTRDRAGSGGSVDQLARRERVTNFGGGKALGKKVHRTLRSQMHVWPAAHLWRCCLVALFSLPGLALRAAGALTAGGGAEASRGSLGGAGPGRLREAGAQVLAARWVTTACHGRCTGFVR